MNQMKQMKYKCLSCGRQTDELISYPGDTTEYWGVPGTENYLGCPYCRSDEVVEEEGNYDI